MQTPRNEILIGFILVLLLSQPHFPPAGDGERLGFAWGEKKNPKKFHEKEFLGAGIPRSQGFSVSSTKGGARELSRLFPGLCPGPAEREGSGQGGQIGVGKKGI